MLRSNFLVLLVAVAGFAVYFMLYSRRINRKIASGEVRGRRMPDIPAVIRIVLIAALLFYTVGVTVSLKDVRKQLSAENRNDFAVIDLSDGTFSGYHPALAGTDASYVKNYSRESNAGYQKATTQEGEFTFTAFTRTGKHDAFHPDFFCFVDYTGEAASGLSLYEYYEFTDTLTGENVGGIGSGGEEVGKSFLIVGNVNETELFKVTVSVLDGKGEETYLASDATSAAKYALSTGSAVIMVK